MPTSPHVSADAPTDPRRALALSSLRYARWAVLVGCVLAWHTPPTVAQDAPTNDTNLSSDLASDGEAGGDALDSLLDADITQLAQTDIAAPVFGEEVTTVSRQEGTVGRSPAAVYVITGEMIRRSGVRSVPEALRLAPGVQVARIDSNKWAVSIRGFNQRFANKLLIQIDGRTVYTPLFAGVFWDVQHVLLEDVDRIEVIRGPGASVWGANAVNGVINIITKTADETRGVFAEGGLGEERGFASARVGGQSGNLAWRTYASWFDRDEGLDDRANDSWDMGRVGFRTDWRPDCCTTVTVQGDLYDGDAGQALIEPLPGAPFLRVRGVSQQLSGGNALMRWTRDLGDDSSWSLQTYFDRTERFVVGDGFREDRNTFDIDFQHRFRFRQWHAIIWGFGFRNTHDELASSPFRLAFLPPERSLDTTSLFLQDEMTLLEERLYFTLGSKISWNDFTNFEYQPTARLLYTPSKRTSVWAAVSRAVRVPSRSSDDVRAITVPTPVPVFPTYPTVFGNRDVESEELLAWEMGMRSAPNDKFFWDLAAFYNDYRNLHAVRPGIPGFDPGLGVFSLPLRFFNGLDAESYGFELASTWNIHERWTLRGAYSFLRIDTHPDPAASNGGSAETQSPRNQFFLHSSWDIHCYWTFDLIGRYVDQLEAESIPSYFELDARIAWRPTDTIEFAVAGRNLLDHAHPEFGDDIFGGVLATETQRDVYGSISLRY